MAVPWVSNSSAINLPSLLCSEAVESPTWFIAMATARYEPPLVVFLWPESARANLGSGVVLDGVIRSLLQDRAYGMALRAFEFQHADPFVIAHRSPFLT